MKKLLALLLLLPCLALSACGGGSETPAPADSSNPATASEPVEGTTPDTDAPTETPTEPDTAAATEAETEEPMKELYYVRTPGQPPEKTGITYPAYEFEDYEQAVAKADDARLSAMGYAVYGADGEFLYGLNNEYVTNMLFRAKYIVDFARENHYRYGSAAKNPAVSFHLFLSRGVLREKIVSCDRFVGWVLYEMGYTDQPTDAGMFVWANASSSEHNLMIFLEKHNYERIDRTTDFKAGDIVFVRPTTSSGGSPYGAHVFICAGSAGEGRQFYRYDHGSDTRIQSVQPSREGISELFCVYRPTQTTLEDMPAGS